MEKSFKFESFYKGNDIADELEITINIWGTEDDYGFEDMVILDGDKLVETNDLSDEEYKKIEAKADKLAYENAYEAYHDKMLAAADDWMDAYKHGDFND